MAEGNSCEHLNRLVDVLAKELWQTKEVPVCEDCFCPGPNLWVCLQEDCLLVGCSENDNDHNTYHFKEMPQHCVHLNLTTKRVWCYRCNMEVFPRAALANAALHQEAAAPFQMEGARGGSSAGLEWGLERLGGVDPVGDDQDSSDAGEEEECILDGKPRGLVGLQNMGNTCYMNSALQALSNTPPLTQYFLYCGATVDFLADSKKPGLSRSFQKLVREIWNKKTRGYVVPNGILYGIRNVHPMFRGYHQHDTQEFLRCFMDQLHEELKEPFRENQQTFISRQPKQGSRGSDACNQNRRLYRGPQSPATSHENISSNKYYRVHSQSECSSGVSSLLPGHRWSASYCLLPQDGTKDEAMQPLHQSSGEGEGEGEEEEESYETCDSGVSDSAELSGEEGYQRKSSAGKGDCLGSGDASESEGPCDGPTAGVRDCSPAQSGYRRSSTDLDGRLGNGDASKSEGLCDGPAGDERDRMPAQGSYRSVISDVFDGRLLSSVQCLTCNRISTRVETFQDLSLPIPSRDHMAVLHGGSGGPQAGGGSPGEGRGSRGVACSDAVYSATASQEGWMWWLLSWFRSWLYGPAVTLHDCLAAFFSADELKGDNMYSCEKCNKLRNGVKFSKVLGLPEVLCVHLKRFRHELMSSTKIGAKVSFPLSGLDMRPYLHKDCTSGVSTYDLVAVICHVGTAGGGHYTCVARNQPSERWFEFDDQYVTGCTPTQVAACEAYVLFYKKSNPRMASLRQQALELLETTLDLNDIKFYISKQWINRFNTYAEPGPIDNGDFLCEHGGVSPERLVLVERLTTEISQPLWEFFYQNFGGGPACNQPHACAVCHAATEKLKRRQKNELQRFHSYTYSEQKAIYAISMNWFRSWQAFAHGKVQQPPPPIDNSSIVVKSSTQDNNASLPQAMLKAGSDYSQLGEDCWLFFHGVYGGGPEVKLKSAPHYSNSNTSNTISYSQSYNSNSNTRSYNSNLHKSRNYQELSSKQQTTDSEDNSSVERQTVKSLSNADLFFISNLYADADKNAVKTTQSLQDVSTTQQYAANVIANERQNSHRMSIESDSLTSVETNLPLKNNMNGKRDERNNDKQKKNADKKTVSRQNGKPKVSKSSRKRSNRAFDTLKSNSSCEEITPVDASIADAVRNTPMELDERVPDYPTYDESTETQAEMAVPKVAGKRGKSRNSSTDMQSVCSSMQAVLVDMKPAESAAKAYPDGSRNTFNKRASRE